jgi:acetyltransferase-like isoleucine patch superfamily enzyme
MQNKTLWHMSFLIILYSEIKRKYYQIRYPNVSIAEGVVIRGVLKVSGAVKVEIGAGSRISKNVGIYGSGHLVIGQNVLLNGPNIGCFQAITIGNECLISDCFLADSDYHNVEPHLRRHPPSKKVSAPIIIEQNVWIGARATVMKGVCIGSNSVVGLGCVVRKSIPPNVIVIGNPQQIVKHFDTQDENIIAHSMSEVA